MIEFRTDTNCIFLIQILRPSGERGNKFIRIYEEGESSARYTISAAQSSKVTFPDPGSNGTVVTFSVELGFERQKKYYILVDAGKIN